MPTIVTSTYVSAMMAAAKGERVRDALCGISEADIKAVVGVGVVAVN